MTNFRQIHGKNDKSMKLRGFRVPNLWGGCLGVFTSLGRLSQIKGWGLPQAIRVQQFFQPLQTSFLNVTRLPSLDHYFPEDPFNTSLWCLLGIRQSVTRSKNRIHAMQMYRKIPKRTERGIILREKVKSHPRSRSWRDSSIPDAGFTEKQRVHRLSPEKWSSSGAVPKLPHRGFFPPNRKKTSICALTVVQI